ncbi:hypothetical protein JH25_27705 [Pseudomonas sp. BRG-100]|nr:hypothetical protein JH25_27705 [Pseudomonas sp. BRG-100]
MADWRGNLPTEVARQADKIIAEIQKSGSIILAVKAGARAHGFVLGLSCAACITDDQANRLLAAFDDSTEAKLRELSLWTLAQR